jgi:hypothetical protein
LTGRTMTPASETEEPNAKIRGRKGAKEIVIYSNSYKYHPQAGCNKAEGSAIQ